MTDERTVTVKEELYHQFFEVVGEGKRLNHGKRTGRFTRLNQRL